MTKKMKFKLKLAVITTIQNIFMKNRSILKI